MSNKYKERIAAAMARRTPEAIERAEREQAEMAAFNERNRIGFYEGKADEAGIPRTAYVRRICLEPTVDRTEALVAFEAAEAWREKNRTGYGTAPAIHIVGGPPGTGKSCAMARVVARHAGTSLFVSANTITTTIRSGFGETEARWRAWLETDLLGIDDMGTETGDPVIMRNLLLQRYEAGLLTLCTANLSKKDFRDRFFDARLADRLAGGQSKQGLGWYSLATGVSLRDPANRSHLTKASI